MFGIARLVRKAGEFARKDAEGDRVVDLDEFLRSASAIAGEEPARAAAPSEPLPLELDARLDEALWETFPASDPVAVSPAQLNRRSAGSSRKRAEGHGRRR